MFGLKIYADRSDYGNCLSLTFIDEHPDGRRLLRGPIQTYLVEVGDDYISEPSMKLSKGQGQELMDQLWQLGLRPTDAGPVDGQVAALRDHIKSLQGFIDKLLGMEG